MNEKTILTAIVATALSSYRLRVLKELGIIDPKIEEFGDIPRKFYDNDAIFRAYTDSIVDAAYEWLNMFHGRSNN